LSFALKAIVMIIMRFNALTLVWLGTFILPLVTLAEPAPDADFSYTVSDGKATITGYSGPGGDLVIPSTLGGYPVETIRFNQCFY